MSNNVEIVKKTLALKFTKGALNLQACFAQHRVWHIWTEFGGKSGLCPNTNDDRTIWFYNNAISTRDIADALCEILDDLGILNSIQKTTWLNTFSDSYIVTAERIPTIVDIQNLANGPSVEQNDNG